MAKYVKWCPESGSNRHGGVNLLGILSPVIARAVASLSFGQSKSCEDSPRFAAVSNLRDFAAIRSGSRSAVTKVSPARG
jgi:hypothetical protein